MSNSEEEEIARDYICFEENNCTVIVVDATRLERNLNLVKQISEMTDNIVVCVNLLDEAAKKGIKINLDILEKELGVPVVGVIARKKKTLKELTKVIESVCKGEIKCNPKLTEYEENVENSIKQLQNEVKKQKMRIEKDPSLKGYLSSVEDPLFFHQDKLKTVYDYDYIIQGHTHFEVLEEDQNTKFYAIRGAALGFSEYDSVEHAKYLILTFDNEHIYFEAVEVPYDREKMTFQINHATFPNQLIRKYARI